MTRAGDGAEFTIGPLISIIIPFKDAAPYLGNCLNSVIIALEEFKRRHKGINRFEIILVDNGSTDGSRLILKEYKVIKPLALKVVECQTPGAAAARNLGASIARGEYLWFVDADDTIAEDAIWKLYAAARAGVLDLDGGTGFSPAGLVPADFVMLGVKRTYPDGARNQDGKRDYLPAIPADALDFKSRFVRYGIGPWQIFIRRAWWVEHGFQFYEGMIHEDMELLSSLVLYTNHFASVDEPLYFYQQTAGSVLHSREWDGRALDIFPALEGLYARFASVTADGLKIRADDVPAAETYRAELEWFFIWNLLLDSAKDFARAPRGERRACFGRSRELLQKYFPHWRRNRFLREKSWRVLLRVRLNYWGIIV